MKFLMKIVTVAVFYLGLLSVTEAATLYYDLAQLTGAGVVPEPQTNVLILAGFVYMVLLVKKRS